MDQNEPPFGSWWGSNEPILSETSGSEIRARMVELRSAQSRLSHQSCWNEGLPGASIKWSVTRSSQRALPFCPAQVL